MTKSASELEFLSAIERGEVVTQMTLSKRIGVAVGLINALLKRSMTKGYVKARQAPYKRYAYYLTPTGFSEKSRLVAEFLEVSLDFFRTARSQYSDVFRHLKAARLGRIALVGGGELAEIAVLAASAEDVALSAIVDPTYPRSQRFGVTVVRTVAELGPVDAIVLAERRAPQDAYEALTKDFAADRIFAPDLLHITPDRDALIKAARQGDRRA